LDSVSVNAVASSDVLVEASLDIVNEALARIFHQKEIGPV
jgi:hypothetical protein